MAPGMFTAAAGQPHQGRGTTPSPLHGPIWPLMAQHAKATPARHRWEAACEVEYCKVHQTMWRHLAQGAASWHASAPFLGFSYMHMQLGAAVRTCMYSMHMQLGAAVRTCMYSMHMQLGAAVRTCAHVCVTEVCVTEVCVMCLARVPGVGGCGMCDVPG